MNFRKTQPEAADARLDQWDESRAAYVEAPDNELVARTRRRDLAAYEELFRRHHKRVYNIALRVLSNEAEAADITQDVFVRVYDAIGKLKSDDAFLTWLKTMTVNRCRDSLRKRGRLRIESLDARIQQSDGAMASIEIPDDSNNPQDALEKKFLRQSVHKAIASLSPDAREVVTLFYLDGADIATISKIVGSPQGTVKSRLSRARNDLKRKLRHHVEQ